MGGGLKSPVHALGVALNRWRAPPERLARKSSNYGRIARKDAQQPRHRRALIDIHGAPGAGAGRRPCQTNRGAAVTMHPHACRTTAVSKHLGMAAAEKPSLRWPMPRVLSGLPLADLQGCALSLHDGAAHRGLLRASWMSDCGGLSAELTPARVHTRRCENRTLMRDTPPCGEDSATLCRCTSGGAPIESSSERSPAPPKMSLHVNKAGHPQVLVTPNQYRSPDCETRRPGGAPAMSDESLETTK